MLIADGVGGKTVAEEVNLAFVSQLSSQLRFTTRVYDPVVTARDIGPPPRQGAHV